MLVKEIMNDKHLFIFEDELATKARATVRDFTLRILPVTDGNRKLLGKVSRRDIMTISSSVSPLRVKGIMTPAKHVATIDDDATSTAKAMLKVDVWQAPVTTSTQDKTYRGVVGLENFIETEIRLHPEKLVKEVSDVMTKEVCTCSPEDEIDNVWRFMKEKRFSGLPVVNKGKLVGMITHKDFLESGAIMPTLEATKGRFQNPPKISAIMKTNLVTVGPDEKMIRVAKVLISKDVGSIPVKDKNGKLVGIVDREDVARLLFQ